MKVADPKSKSQLVGKGRFAPHVGLLAIAVGTLVAGPFGAGIGLIVLLLVLLLQQNGAKARR